MLPVPLLPLIGHYAGYSRLPAEATRHQADIKEDAKMVFMKKGKAARRLRKVEAVDRPIEKHGPAEGVGRFLPLEHMISLHEMTEEQSIAMKGSLDRMHLALVELSTLKPGGEAERARVKSTVDDLMRSGLMLRPEDPAGGCEMLLDIVASMVAAGFRRKVGDWVAEFGPGK